MSISIRTQRRKRARAQRGAAAAHVFGLRAQLPHMQALPCPSLDAIRDALHPILTADRRIDGDDACRNVFARARLGICAHKQIVLRSFDFDLVLMR